MKKGFSLPLWVAASAKSAVKKLQGFSFDNYEFLSIPNEKQLISLKVHSAGFLSDKSKVLAITFADSGLDLDITRNLEIWTLVSFQRSNKEDKKKDNFINLIPGYGVGTYAKSAEICISEFAKQLLKDNLEEYIPKDFQLNLEIIFPNGKFLAERTSNRAFGIVDGLSIIGTSAETFLSASPEQINHAKAELDRIVLDDPDTTIIFVIGENGFDLANTNNLGKSIIKVGNWLGPLLVDAAFKNVKRIFILGYHGKMIKLAGGIFHTHNHLADGRMEILTYLAYKEKIPTKIIDKIIGCNNIQDAFKMVESIDSRIANSLWLKIANTIEMKTLQYIAKYTSNKVEVGVGLFDRERKIRWVSQYGKSMIKDKIFIDS